jgi:phosphoribosylcarboxyaminoimidazole (NCAIR) mutase
MPEKEAKAQSRPQVGVIMGSDTDLPVMSEAIKTLKDFEIPYEVEVTSAHRSTPSPPPTVA